MISSTYNINTTPYSHDPQKKLTEGPNSQAGLSPGIIACNRTVRPSHVTFFVSTEDLAQFSVSCSIRIELEAVQLESMDQSFDDSRLGCDKDFVLVLGGVAVRMPVVVAKESQLLLQVLVRGTTSRRSSPLALDASLSETGANVGGELSSLSLVSFSMLIERSSISTTLFIGGSVAFSLICGEISMMVLLLLLYYASIARNKERDRQTRKKVTRWYRTAFAK
jgi:hypothetical protein